MWERKIEVIKEEFLKITFKPKTAIDFIDLNRKFKLNFKFL